MNLRDALVQQSPSLALQRAAADEIASLDARLARCALENLSLIDESIELTNTITKYQSKSWRDDNRISDLEDYLEARDLTKDFEEWLARSTEK